MPRLTTHHTTWIAILAVALVVRLAVGAWWQSRLGDERQVIAITHLPQVASMASTHFRIEKASQRSTALASVEQVSGEELVGEIARMLGADHADDAASRHARELLADGSGGVGYLLKDRVADPADFADAVRRVAGGGTALDPEAVSQLLSEVSGNGRLDELTPREGEVLSLMAEGRSNSGIAERLVVTERAVEKHVSNIFFKLNLPATSHDHRRVLAVLAWVEGGG